MEATKFIEIVEKLANVSTIYIDVNAPQDTYDKEYNRRIADAFKQAKTVLELVED